MIKVGYNYKARFIKKSSNSQGPITKFALGTAIRNAPEINGRKQYYNFEGVVYDDLDIQDGEDILITAIDGIDVREYNGKTLIDLILRVKRHTTDPPRAPAYGRDEFPEEPFEL